MCLRQCSELSKKKQNTETFFSETILQFEHHLMREIDLGRLELLNELSDVDNPISRESNLSEEVIGIGQIGRIIA